MIEIVAHGLDFILLFFLVVTAIAVIVIPNLITSTVLLAIFSLLMAAQYLVLGAPDVAITEAAVGAGISTILLLLALSLVSDKEVPAKGNLFVPIIVALSTLVALIYTTFGMPPFGHADNPAQQHVSAYYIEQSAADIGISNVVTSVLASYRGFDTLGETVVIFTAGIAVLLLLMRKKSPRGGK